MSGPATHSLPNLPVALDAVGGDFGALPNVEGAVAAAKSGLSVLLVGDRVKLHAELGKYPGASALPLEVVDAPDVIGMDEHASDVRGRKEASINVANRLVKEGRASAVVSMGHSGASMAASLLTLGRLKGVDRPAILTHLPSKTGFVTVLDVGANADVKPAYLAQWAGLASTYLRVVEDRQHPSVGLLSIGEEEHKGNELTKAATPLLKALPINFIGNVEGRDIFTGHADVIVCDGFVGNVALKVSEGLVEVGKHLLQDALKASVSGKIGYLLARNAFAELKKRVDYSEYGGAPLLGVKGCTIICHGRSNANAIRNAIRVAAEFAQSDLNRRLEAGLAYGRVGRE